MQSRIFWREYWFGNIIACIRTWSLPTRLRHVVEGWPWGHGIFEEAIDRHKPGWRRLHAYCTAGDDEKHSRLGIGPVWSDGRQFFHAQNVVTRDRVIWLYAARLKHGRKATWVNSTLNP
jgi:hypothetical protein